MPWSQGPGRGIGKSVALLFAKAGADLAICARSGGCLDTVRTVIEEFGQRCLAKPIDLAEPLQTKAFCDRILNAFGGVDIIVNNAGANSSAYHVSKAALNMLTEGLANELWKRDIDVNSLVLGPTATATLENAEPGAERTPEEILSQGREALPKGAARLGTCQTSG